MCWVGLIKMDPCPCLGHRSGAKVGAPIWREAPEFFYRAPPLFGSRSTISRFGERFRDGQYSLVSFLFAHAQPFVKVGGTCPLRPMESATLVLR